MLREAATYQPLYSAPVSTQSLKHALCISCFDLFVGTGAEKRGPGQEASLKRLNHARSWSHLVGIYRQKLIKSVKNDFGLPGLGHCNHLQMGLTDLCGPLAHGVCLLFSSSSLSLQALEGPCALSCVIHESVSLKHEPASLPQHLCGTSLARSLRLTRSGLGGGTRWSHWLSIGGAICLGGRHAPSLTGSRLTSA